MDNKTINKKIVYDLCVVSDQYRQGNEIKQRFQKIGTEITIFKDGKEKTIRLLDRFINLAGFPNFSDKNYTTSILMYKFLNKELSEGLDENEENLEEEPYQETETRIF
ncbi:hypothetical protein [Treponema putidum]|uniref:hypothetical protein n=1 Tax=Treponema putidum TaxID=221027 RepID=UPI003D8C0A1B